MSTESMNAKERPQAEPIIVHVPLEGRAYDILIGRDLLARAGVRIATLAPGAACAVVTDETVAALHLPALRKSLAHSGIRSAEIVLPPGESTKCYAMLERVCDAVISARMERGDIVVALGGGVIG